MFLQIANSGFPSDCSSESQKAAYVEGINKAMKWTSNEDTLKIAGVRDNVALRSFFKLLSNALLGKFGQDGSGRKYYVSVNNQQDLERCFWREDTIVADWAIMSPNCAELQLESKQQFNKIALKSNCVIAAHVTSYARIIMDKWLRNLLANNITVYYTDTDCFMFEMPKLATIPLPIGYAYGQFKDELASQVVKSFYTLGPKIYQLALENVATLSKETISKLKGFYVSSASGRAVVHDTLFQEFVEKYLANIDAEARLGQWQIKTTKNRQLKSIILQKVIRNSIFSKRVAFRGHSPPIYETMPYGYSEAMFLDLLNTL